MNQQQSVNDLLAKLSENLEILTNIGKAQIEASKKQTDALVVSKGPETKQPEFSPVGNSADYLEYKAFLAKFNYFVKDVSDDRDKLQSLITSLKGTAYEAIKGLTLNARNYEVALEKLKRKY